MRSGSSQFISFFWAKLEKQLEEELGKEVDKGRGQGGGEHGLVEGAGDQPGDVDHMELNGVRVLGTSSS